MKRLLKPEHLWQLSIRLQRSGHPIWSRLLKAVNFFLYHAILPPEAQIGRNLRLEHYALCVVVHPQTKIGDDCVLYHQVTLAAETWIGSPFHIILEKGVQIGAHTVVIARSNTTLVIGENSIVGAGSVVTGSIPRNEVWAGNPARKLREVSFRSPLKSLPSDPDRRSAETYTELAG